MILDTIAEKTRERVKIRKQTVPLEQLRKEAEQLSPDTGFPFERALGKEELSFICEVKKASPSKGLIAPDFPYLQIAGEYEAAGASAISVLTEPEFFWEVIGTLRKLPARFRFRYCARILPWMPI